MCEESRKEFGLVEIDISDIKSKYPESKLNMPYAIDESYKVSHVPILIDKDNFIVDGHHRYLYLRESGYKRIKAVRIDLTFAQTEKLRTADNLIKDFCAVIGDRTLSDEFKRLVRCFQ